MKLIRAHWTLHPSKAKGLYFDETGRPRSPWYDNEIVSKLMTEAAVARELDINYELSVEGVVFKEFRESHILRGKYEVNPGLVVIRYFDFGRVNGTLFSQKDNMGRIRFFHEIVLEKSGTHEQGKVVQAFSANLPADEGFRDYGDPAGNYAHHSKSTDPDDTEKTDFEILASFGIDASPGVSGSIQARRRARIEITKMKLCERIDGQETIMVHESCVTLITALQSEYRYVEDITGKITDEVEEVHPFEDVVDCFAGTILEEYTPRTLNKTPKRQQNKVRRNKFTGRPY